MIRFISVVAALFSWISVSFFTPKSARAFSTVTVKRSQAVCHTSFTVPSDSLKTPMVTAPVLLAMVCRLSQWLSLSTRMPFTKKMTRVSPPPVLPSSHQPHSCPISLPSMSDPRP